jgi:hypothetical protein
MGRQNFEMIFRKPVPLSDGGYPGFSVNRLGVGVVLVEQNVPLALKVAETGYVLHLGRIIREG